MMDRVMLYGLFFFVFVCLNVCLLKVCLAAVFVNYCVVMCDVAGLCIRVFAVLCVICCCRF